MRKRTLNVQVRTPRVLFLSRLVYERFIYFLTSEVRVFVILSRFLSHTSGEDRYRVFY